MLWVEAEIVLGAVVVVELGKGCWLLSAARVPHLPEVLWLLVLLPSFEGA